MKKAPVWHTHMASVLSKHTAPVWHTAYIITHGFHQFVVFLVWRDHLQKEHHRPLAGTHFTVRCRVEDWVDTDGWLYTKIQGHVCRTGVLMMYAVPQHTWRRHQCDTHTWPQFYPNTRHQCDTQPTSSHMDFISLLFSWYDVITCKKSIIALWLVLILPSDVG